MPHLATFIFLFFYNEPELGVGIDPGMDMTPLLSSIGRGSNPRPLDHSFRFSKDDLYVNLDLDRTKEKKLKNYGSI